MIYPSDYTYSYANGVDNKCYTDAYNCNSSTPTSGWIFNMLEGATQWTTAPYSGNSSFAFSVRSSGYVGGYNYGVANAYGGRPVVYLKSSVKLAGGDGSEGNPYTLA